MRHTQTEDLTGQYGMRDTGDPCNITPSMDIALQVLRRNKIWEEHSPSSPLLSRLLGQTGDIPLTAR